MVFRFEIITAVNGHIVSDIAPFFMKRIHLPCPSGSTTQNVSENEVIFYETDTLCVFCIRFVNSRRKIGYNVSIFKGEIHDPEQTIYSGS